MKKQIRPITRRGFIKTGSAAVAGAVLVACGANGDDNNELNENESNENVSVENQSESDNLPENNGENLAAVSGLAPDSSEVTELNPTLPCDDDDETLTQTAGPFYTPNTPERASLIEEGMSGTVLVVSGRVLRTDCQPLANAIVDFWHADPAGAYDNEGFLFRGHQFTDEQGNYQLETIMPGLYPGRTRHIHVRVQGQDTDLLTTQLYFPDDEENQADGIFHESLVVEIEHTTAERTEASFDFVLA